MYQLVLSNLIVIGLFLFCPIVLNKQVAACSKFHKANCSPCFPHISSTCKLFILKIKKGKRCDHDAVDFVLEFKSLHSSEPVGCVVTDMP